MPYNPAEKIRKSVVIWINYALNVFLTYMLLPKQWIFSYFCYHAQVQISEHLEVTGTPYG